MVTCNYPPSTTEESLGLLDPPRWERETCGTCFRKHAIPSEWANDECTEDDGSWCPVMMDWVMGSAQACNEWEEE